jgi:hypothetical protein
MSWGTTCVFCKELSYSISVCLWGRVVNGRPGTPTSGFDATARMCHYYTRNGSRHSSQIPDNHRTERQSLNPNTPILILVAFLLPLLFISLVSYGLWEGRESLQPSHRILGRVAQALCLFGALGCMCIGLRLPLSAIGLLRAVPDTALLAIAAIGFATLYILYFVLLRKQLKQKQGSMPQSQPPAAPSGAVQW